MQMNFNQSPFQVDKKMIFIRDESPIKVNRYPFKRATKFSGY